MKLGTLLGDSLNRWIDRDGLGQAAAVSFYAFFATAPLLVFGLAMTSWNVTSGPGAKESAIDWLSDMVSKDTAESMLSIVRTEALQQSSPWENALAGALFLWAGSLFFYRAVYGTREVMNQAENTSPYSFKKGLIGRLVGIGIALLAGAVICIIFWLASYARVRAWPDMGILSILGFVNTAMMAGGAVALMWYSPKSKPRFTSLAITGAILFVAFFAGRAIFRTPIAEGTIPSTYGVASSIVVVMLWTFYLASAYFIGAAFCAELEKQIGADDSDRGE